MIKVFDNVSLLKNFYERTILGLSRKKTEKKRIINVPINKNV